MPKLDFDEVMEALAEQQMIDSSNVLERVLERKVWVASNGMPGCLNDSFSACTTKSDAIEYCKMIADSGEGCPRGLVTALREDGIFYENSYVYRVERMTVRDLL